MNLREAAQQALEALEKNWDGCVNTDNGEAITALRAALADAYENEAWDAYDAALAEPVQPVAWMVYTLDGKSVCVTDNPADFGPEHKALPLYTALPQRKPLSDEEIKAALVSVDPEPKRLPPGFRDFARAVIAAYEAKNDITGGSDKK